VVEPDLSLPVISTVPFVRVAVLRQAQDEGELVASRGLQSRAKLSDAVLSLSKHT
jgi:hypothetical protein